MKFNLNTAAPKSPADFDYSNQRRGGGTETAEVFFGDVASAVETFINDSETLVGCVAWVRSPRLIDALSQRPVSIVVNKEFSLRVSGHREREPLLRLVGGVPRSSVPEPAKGTGKLDAVRCAGWAVRGKFGALMHHKFLVRLERKGRKLIPTAVWTGSFNLTTGAESNIENGMILTEPGIVQAFFDEFARVYAISEPLAFAEGKPTPGGGRGGAVRVAAKRKAPARRKRKPTATKPRTTARRKRA